MGPLRAAVVDQKQMFLIVGHLATPLSDAAFASAAARSCLRGILEPLPGAASDFVVAAARAPNDVTIEILWGEVSGFAGTHQALHLDCRSVRRRSSILKLVARMPGTGARDYDAATWP